MTNDAAGQSIQIADHVRNPWSSPARLAAGQKWRAKAEIMGRGITAAFVEVARIERGMDVLDLASGEGDPALTLAALVGKDGTITATDVNSEPLEISAARAREEGIGNILFQVADAQHLPFEGATFDLATCRFGAMFFPDPLAAMHEIWRVLKPHGRVALAVWGSIEQPWFRVFVTPLLRHAGGPLLASEGPNPFRFAEPGTLSVLLNEAGFREVQEEAKIVERVWTGSPEEAWEYFRDHAIAFGPLMGRVPPDKWEEITDEIVMAISNFRVGSSYHFPALINLAAAAR
jgi:ubiquinone/menaquinone biosynthesis C-methylase UbiE